LAVTGDAQVVGISEGKESEHPGKGQSAESSPWGSFAGVEEQAEQKAEDASGACGQRGVFQGLRHESAQVDCVKN
jgi:hypothetical protein